MNQMEIFKNPEFGSIRVIEENGKYLFCGTDVAAALGYSNPRDAIIRHCRYVVKRDAPHPQSPDRKSTRLNSSHSGESRMPSSA